MPKLERITKPGPKRLLSVDGGGIRGVLSLGILRRIEAILKAQRGGRDDFRLSHYFDYIAGTSTGGIIAAGLSVGMSVDEILTFYKEAGAQMFVKANRWPRSSKTCSAPQPSSALMKSRHCCCWSCAMPPRTRLGRSVITLTPSTTIRSDMTTILNFPLWQLVRASTAAPAYSLPK